MVLFLLKQEIQEIDIPWIAFEPCSNAVKTKMEEKSDAVWKCKSDFCRR